MGFGGKDVPIPCPWVIVCRGGHQYGVEVLSLQHFFQQPFDEVMYFLPQVEDKSVLIPSA